MKRETMTYLQEAFAAPEPERKEAFIKKTPRVQMSMASFVKTQIGYIRKRVWVLSILLFLLALNCTEYVGQESAWAIASLTPYIAVCAVTESARSITYGMQELEMSTRFSLKSVTIARLFSIGFLHLLILCALIPVAGKLSFLPMVQSGIYLVVPYLLTSLLGLMAVRKLHDREIIYVCLGSAVLVSLLYSMARVYLSWIYEEKYLILWGVMAAYLLVRVWKEYKEMIYQTEEFAWN